MIEAKFQKKWEPVDFTVYFSFIKWPVILLLVLEIAFRWWSNHLAGGLFFDQREIVIWLIRLAIFAFLGWRVVKNFGPSLAVAAMSGAIAGLIIGLVIAIIRFFDGVKVWKFFNLITETTLVTVAGALVATLVVYAVGFRKNID